MREYTRDTEQRLTRAVTRFFESLGDAKGLWVTLNTRERDPERAKILLRRWLAAMRYHFGVYGVYCLEFDQEQFCHYHLALGVGPSYEKFSTNKIREKAKGLWEGFGQSHRSSFDLRHVYDKDDRSRIVRYMAKAADEFGNPHQKRCQKLTPDAFKARGTRANWWGQVRTAANCQKAAESTPEPVNELPHYPEGIAIFQPTERVPDAA